MDPEEPPPLLVTDRQHAILQLLIEAGIRESGADANDRPFEDGPPEGFAMMLDMALDANASVDHLLGILTWGHDELATSEMRQLALKIAALGEIPPA
jgi:hypothetical protein